MLIFGPESARMESTLETIGPKIAGPNVEANSSSWISAEGQGLRMRTAAHTALAPTAD